MDSTRWGVVSLQCAMKEYFSILEIGQIAGLAETTIKQTYKFMLPRVAELFPDDFKFSVPIDSLPAS